MRARSFSEIAALVRRHPVWAQADDAALRTLSRGWRVVDAPPRTLLVRCGDRALEIHLLLEGTCRVFYPKGKAPEQTVKLLRGPGVFGDIATVMAVPYTASVESLTATRSVAISARCYLAAIESSPHVCFRQYLDLARRFHGAVEFEKIAYSSTVTDRVAAILAAFASEFGRGTSRGILIDAPLSRDDLARHTASNRRSVARALAELCERGAVERYGRRFVVVSFEKLVSGS